MQLILQLETVFLNLSLKLETYFNESRGKKNLILFSQKWLQDRSVWEELWAVEVFLGQQKLFEWLECASILPSASLPQKQIKHTGALSLDLGAGIGIWTLISKDGKLNK